MSDTPKPTLLKALVKTAGELNDVRRALRDAIRSGIDIGYDTEWTAPSIIHRGKASPDVLRAKLVGFSIDVADRGSWYIALRHDDMSAVPAAILPDSWRLLGFLNHPKARVVAHNWKGELHVLHNEGLPVQCVMLDSQLLAWLVGWRLPGAGGLKLKALSEVHLRHVGPDFKALAQGRTAAQMTPAEIAPYAADDASLARRLAAKAWRLILERGLEAQWALDQRLIPVSAHMERSGFPIDAAQLLRDAERCELEMVAVSGEFRQLTMTTLDMPTKVRESKPCATPGEPNCMGGYAYYKNGKARMHTVVRPLPETLGADVGNDRQVSRWLFDELKWWPTRIQGTDWNGNAKQVPYPRTEVGWSTAEEDLRPFTQLEGNAGLAARLRLRFQALRKYATTYTRTMVSLAEQSGDGLLHCSFKQDGTDTQRYSSSGPNLQNLPSSERLDLPWLKDLPDIRASFVAPPGWRIVVRDLSQIELRMTAHYSRDPSLVEVYRNGGDIHALTMAKLKVDRRNGKIGNFSTIYEISARSLAIKVSLATNVWPPNVAAAQRFIDGFLTVAYPGVKDMQDDLADAAEREGFSTAITGFKAPFPSDEWQGKRRHGARRRAINYVIQGGAGGIIKWVMAELYELWLHRGVLGTKVWLMGQVHDELVARVTDDYADQVNQDMEWAMEQAGIYYGLLVPLTSSGGSGPTWADAKH